MSADTVPNSRNPNSPYPPASPTTLWGAIYEFAKGQPFNNVLMLILLGGIGAIGWGAYISIPIHIKEIRQGYKEVSEDNQKALATILETFKEDRTRDRDHQKEMINLIIKNRVGSVEPVKE